MVTDRKHRSTVSQTRSEAPIQLGNGGSEERDNERERGRGGIAPTETPQINAFFDLKGKPGRETKGHSFSTHYSTEWLTHTMQTAAAVPLILMVST